jgi:tetratricopeptide (TPR) repeat protein
LQYAGRLASLAKETALHGNHAEGLRLIREALVYDEKLEGVQREDRTAAHHIIMGDIYVSADSLPQAEKCYQYAVSVFEKINRQHLLAASLLSLGNLQIKQKRFSDAIATLKNCMAICEKINLLRTQHAASQYLYEAYKQTGNTAQALMYLEQFRDLNDIVFNENSQKQISEFEVKYETAKKDG